MSHFSHIIDFIFIRFHLLVQVDGVGGHVGLLLGVRVVAVDLEISIQSKYKCKEQE